MHNREKLSGRKKAAILIMSLGPELAGQIFKHLSDEDIEQLTLEIANLNKVSPEIKDEVLNEFHQMALAQNYISRGGIVYARELLEKALGPQKAVAIINRLTASLQVRPFDAIRKADPSQLLNFIQGEHPQTIALIIAYLKPNQAAAVLSGLKPELQADVAKRVATMDRTSPEVIKEVERILEKKMSTLVVNEYASAGGIESIVNILNLVDRGTEKTIMDELDETDPELAEEIRKRMFVFEDIVLLDSRAIQHVLRIVDMKDVALALKTASEEVKNVIFSNLSKRAAQMLKEDIEFMGPVRLREVEEAQQRIVNEIRRLEEAGEIVIARGGEGDIVV
ncbi:flagellar motor switch protein FliG [Anoxybacter fermentans]|uniref:Flagellar motor switch protein FliG n=1 Tax=Anoxybacter fermentans TaxID=1323375 RepID=A0A3Q9HRD5_9FIRM|nr:flagellar motor switch protein FliG [Anoxybacter fermentans]AZR73880.1 flagellar motor switch protein FliG [Anoxybacter fermentans]